MRKILIVFIALLLSTSFVLPVYAAKNYEVLQGEIVKIKDRNREVTIKDNLTREKMKIKFKQEHMGKITKGDEALVTYKMSKDKFYAIDVLVLQK